MVQPASDEDCLSAPGTVRAAVLGLKGGEAQARYAARCGSAGRELLSNIMALQGINMFRQMPTRPEVALSTLQRALSSLRVPAPRSASSLRADTPRSDSHDCPPHSDCTILLLCCGELYSQTGEMVAALECFRSAHRSAPHNPLCLVNAARTYQQLSQLRTAERHLQAALLLDPAMAMVRVDLAQNLLLSGQATRALSLLDEALLLARQVSEIRDVLTARTIAVLQLSLEQRGLYCSSEAARRQRGEALT
mmetsp:Transcript_24156/g.54232  ORF Transcript_24156/g.54232 Transcript_24156/m.54232 type:complete len:250 (-) Transcript_24156:134-883(-)